MKDNYCVIMGGGIGSRFWPFSRESYPKQFLDFFGSGRSLLQMTFDRFSKFIPLENIYVVTNEQYASLVKQQLPELQEKQVLLEPARRNTAPCIAYAAYHIRACNPNANIVVAPSDHLILKEDIFQQDVQKCLDFVRTHKALVTLGIRPGRPETGYGYIQSSETLLGEFTKVKTFLCNCFRTNWVFVKVETDSGLYGWGDATGNKVSIDLDDYPSANPPMDISGTQYDIAYKKWGNKWRMPTSDELRELVSECSWTEKTLNGVDGVECTGPNGNSIFFPYGGHRDGSTVKNKGFYGDYWSSTRGEGSWKPEIGIQYATHMILYSSTNVIVNASSKRYMGHSVRPVTD